MPQRITILQDKREKTPLIFPKTLPRERKSIFIDIEKATLPTGDYALKGHEKTCLIERKGSLDELCACTMGAKNANFLGTDGQLDRLAASCDIPILLIERSLKHLTTPTRYAKNPPAILDSVMSQCLRRGIALYVVPGGSVQHRRLLGEFVARLLVNASDVVTLEQYTLRTNEKDDSNAADLS